VQRKLTACKQGNHQECKRLKRLFDKMAKNDREQFYNRMADEAEAGMVRNDLCAAYLAIRALGGNAEAQHSGSPISHASGVPCKLDEDTVQHWAEDYTKAL